MNWYQITIHTVSEAVEAISYMLGEMGITGVEIQDPRDILWQEKDPTAWDFIDEDLLAGMNTEEVQGLFERYNVSRIEYELCGYEINYAKQSASLNLPFSQTNTAGHCTLYALCKNGDREFQEEVKACPKYCESYALIYPEHLQMLGKYNSLFMWNEVIEIDEKVDRIVWNMG